MSSPAPIPLPDRVSDEVWQHLEPTVARDRRPTRQVGLLVSLALIIAAGHLWYSGLLRPQLAVDDPMIHGSVEEQVLVVLTMRNRGRFPVTVLSAGSTGPGLEPRRVEAAWPLTLQPDERVELRYAYAVLDCGAVARDAWIPQVVVARPWGSMTVTLLGTRNELTWSILAAPRCG